MQAFTSRSMQDTFWLVYSRLDNLVQTKHQLCSGVQLSSFGFTVSNNLLQPSLPQTWFFKVAISKRNDFCLAGCLCHSDCYRSSTRNNSFNNPVQIFENPGCPDILCQVSIPKIVAPNSNLENPSSLKIIIRLMIFSFCLFFQARCWSTKLTLIDLSPASHKLLNSIRPTQHQSQISTPFELFTFMRMCTKKNKKKKFKFNTLVIKFAEIIETKLCAYQESIGYVTV